MPRNQEKGCFFFFQWKIFSSLLLSFSLFVATEMYMEGSSSTNQSRQWYKLWHYLFPLAIALFVRIAPLY